MLLTKDEIDDKLKAKNAFLKTFKCFYFLGYQIGTTLSNQLFNKFWKLYKKRSRKK